MEQEKAGSAAPIGVGARLKSAREAAGMSLGEVADRLKLSVRQLEAIERDDFSALPGATFVRGFVRNYARFLELDPEPLMQALEAHFPSAVHDVANLVRDHGAQHAMHELESGPSAPLGRWLAVAAVVLALGGAAAWFLLRNGGESAPQKAPDQTLAPMLTEKPAASQPAVQAVASAPVAKAPEASKPQAAKLDEGGKPAAQAASAGAAQADGARVTLNVKQDAWVSIVDARGRKLVYGLMQSGTAKDVSGTPPFKVVLGNASQVELSYNGQAVDFSSRIRGSTAKIELK